MKNLVLMFAFIASSSFAISENKEATGTRCDVVNGKESVQNIEREAPASDLGTESLSDMSGRVKKIEKRRPSSND